MWQSIALLLLASWLPVAFTAYWIGYSSRSQEVLHLRRDKHNLMRWLENQRRATIESDLDLELERMRNV